MPSGFLIGILEDLYLHIFFVALQRLPVFGEGLELLLAKDTDSQFIQDLKKKITCIYKQTT